MSLGKRHIQCIHDKSLSPYLSQAEVLNVLTDYLIKNPNEVEFLERDLLGLAKFPDSPVRKWFMEHIPATVLKLENPSMLLNVLKTIENTIVHDRSCSVLSATIHFTAAMLPGLIAFLASKKISTNFLRDIWNSLELIHLRLVKLLNSSESLTCTVKIHLVSFFSQSFMMETREFFKAADESVINFNRWNEDRIKYLKNICIDSNHSVVISATLNMLVKISQKQSFILHLMPILGTFARSIHANEKMDSYKKKSIRVSLTTVLGGIFEAWKRKEGEVYYDRLRKDYNLVFDWQALIRREENEKKMIVQEVLEKAPENAAPIKLSSRDPRLQDPRFAGVNVVESEEKKPAIITKVIGNPYGDDDSDDDNDNVDDDVIMADESSQDEAEADNDVEMTPIPLKESFLEEKKILKENMKKDLEKYRKALTEYLNQKSLQASRGTFVWNVMWRDAVRGIPVNINIPGGDANNRPMFKMSIQAFYHEGKGDIAAFWLCEEWLDDDEPNYPNYEFLLQRFLHTIALLLASNPEKNIEEPLFRFIFSLPLFSEQLKLSMISEVSLPFLKDLMSGCFRVCMKENHRNSRNALQLLLDCTAHKAMSIRSQATRYVRDLYWKYSSEVRSHAFVQAERAFLPLTVTTNFKDSYDQIKKGVFLTFFVSTVDPTFFIQFLRNHIHLREEIKACICEEIRIAFFTMSTESVQKVLESVPKEWEVIKTIPTT